MSINYCPCCGADLQLYQQSASVAVSKAVESKNNSVNTLPGPNINDLLEDFPPPEHFYIVGQTLEFNNIAYIIQKVDNLPLRHQKVYCVPFTVTADSLVLEDTAIILKHNGDNILTEDILK